MPEKWNLVSSRIEYQDRWITHRIDKCLMADGRPVHDYHVIEFPDWVHVVAITTDMTIVLVREYRHGAGEVVLGLPSGTVDPGDESALQTSKRELMEETGYSARDWSEVQIVYANPATQTNKAHTYLALGAALTGEVNFDPAEDIDLVEMPVGECFRKLRNREFMMQGMHVAGLYAAASVIGRNPDPRYVKIAQEII